jgi:hypothetical protein
VQSVWKQGAWGRVLGLTERKWHNAGENFIMRNFIVKYSLSIIIIRIISNYMKLMSTKAGSLPFANKQTSMVFTTNCVKLMSRTDCIRDLGVFIDTKLHFHQEEDNIFSQAIKLLGLIQTLTFSFSSLHSPFCLYTAL